MSFQVLWEVGARAKQLTLLRRGISSPRALSPAASGPAIDRVKSWEPDYTQEGAIGYVVRIFTIVIAPE
jgi:hypothetical protein